jgi:hypothetical protein
MDRESSSLPGANSNANFYTIVSTNVNTITHSLRKLFVVWVER